MRQAVGSAVQLRQGSYRERRLGPSLLVPCLRHERVGAQETQDSVIAVGRVEVEEGLRRCLDDDVPLGLLGHLEGDPDVPGQHGRRDDVIRRVVPTVGSVTRTQYAGAVAQPAAIAGSCSSSDRRAEVASGSARTGSGSARDREDRAWARIPTTLRATSTRPTQKKSDRSSAYAITRYTEAASAAARVNGCRVHLTSRG